MARSLTPSRPLKILLIGDTKTGKQSYVTRLIQNKFPNDAWTNKQCVISSMKFKIDEDNEIPIQIFNIRGSERGKSRIKKYFKNIDGYIVMFDVTAPETYDNVMGWKSNVDDENKPKLIPSILLANKCDLQKDEDVRNQMDGIQAYCDALLFCAYFETSNKDDIGIKQSLQYLIRQILESSNPPPPIIPPLQSIPQEYTLKIIVIGELGTGKTAMVQRYVKNTFSGNYLSTIGSDLALKKIHYKNDATINIHIWDIAGDERFGAMTHLFYKDAAGCLIVFDVSRASTLKGAVKWKDDFDTKVNFDEDKQVPCVLVGNKCDLMKDGIVMSDMDMANFCRTHKFIRWFETSAKENKNIRETFSFLIDEIMNNSDNGTGVRTRTNSRIITLQDDDPVLSNNNVHTCCNT